MSEDVAHWGRIEPREEDPASIARTWNATEYLALSMGEADVESDGTIECNTGEPTIDYDDMVRLVVGISGKYPRALFRVVTEGRHFGDFPEVTYFLNARYYTVPFALPGFQPELLERPSTRSAPEDL